VPARTARLTPQLQTLPAHYVVIIFTVVYLLFLDVLWFISYPGSFEQLFSRAERGTGKESARSHLLLDPKERMELLAYLDALLGCVKSLQASNAAILADVEAIRNEVFDDPEEVAQHRANMRLAVSTDKPVADEAVYPYDELMLGIAETQQYDN